MDDQFLALGCLYEAEVLVGYFEECEEQDASGGWECLINKACQETLKQAAKSGLTGPCWYASVTTKR